jgi:acetyltransferase
MALANQSTSSPLAIRPCPRELEETIEFESRPLQLRPIRPKTAGLTCLLRRVAR